MQEARSFLLLVSFVFFVDQEYLDEESHHSRDINEPGRTLGERRLFSAPSLTLSGCSNCGEMRCSSRCDVAA